MAELKIISGPGSGRTASLEPGVVLRIGRGPEAVEGGPPAALLAIDDKKLSRAHLEVFPHGGGWAVRDLGSSNGTFVDGNRVTEKLLQPNALIQAGACVLELVSGPGEGGPVHLNETATEDPRPRAGRGTLPLRAPRRRGSPAGGSRSATPFVLAAVLAAIVVLALFWLTSSRKDEPLANEDARPPPPPAVRELPLAAAAPPAPIIPEAVAVAKRGDRETEGAGDGSRGAAEGSRESLDSIDSAALASEYRSALAVIEAEAPPAEAAALRARVLETARAEVASRAAEADRLSAAEDFDGARTLLEDILLRLPEDLVPSVLVVLERVHDLEEAARGRAATAEATPAPAGDADPFRKRLLDLSASLRDLTSSAPADPAAWEALAAQATTLAGEWRAAPGYSNHRLHLRRIHVQARIRAARAGRFGALTSATRMEWRENRLSLQYDFESDDELRDFHLVPGKDSSIRRAGGALQLRGECRLLQGNPFEGRIVVRGQVPAGGYGGTSPNINVALPTRQGDVLTDPARPPPSVLNAGVAGGGPPPDDFLAFCIGYRKVTAVYGGRQLEQITVVGRPDAVQLPANTVLAGRSGRLFHTDARECLWAAPVRGRLQGALRFEISLDEEEPSWKVNGKDMADLRAVGARWRGGGGRPGSVTLFTNSSQVRFESLEVEGEVQDSWIRRVFEMAFDALETEGPRD
ncbi:MAG TPA: FHA domain-containing protein [Planctomycetota bacterium]|nr:FHA domain-containing protein [Planctomycetota bacterium]